jgi:hypothetical protein
MPSQRFGVNAAWWWVSVLAHNLNAIMKRRVLGPVWADKRLTAIRFSPINLPCRVLERARRLIIHLSQWQPMANFLIEVRCRIAALVPGSTRKLTSAPDTGRSGAPIELRRGDRAS